MVFGYDPHSLADRMLNKQKPQDLLETLNTHIMNATINFLKQARDKGDQESIDQIYSGLIAAGKETCAENSPKYFQHVRETIMFAARNGDLPQAVKMMESLQGDELTACQKEYWGYISRQSYTLKENI